MDQLCSRLEAERARAVRHERATAQLESQLSRAAQREGTLRRQVGELEDRCTELAARVTDLRRQLAERTTAAARALSELERHRSSAPPALTRTAGAPGLGRRSPPGPRDGTEERNGKKPPPGAAPI